ncbi:MAG: crossover junction endodeoxyribonuclease RuvC [Patescibacteria group bacterium]
MKVLGIDPGINLLGWGLVERDRGTIRALDYGCIVTEKNSYLPDRLIAIYEELRVIIKKNTPDEVAIEKLFFFKNQKTVMEVAEARGVAVLSAVKSGRPVFEYTPLQVKQALTGYGRAEKRQIQEMVKMVCCLDTIPKPDDAADALAIAICHAQSSRQMINAQSRI